MTTVSNARLLDSGTSLPSGEFVGCECAVEMSHRLMGRYLSRDVIRT